MNTEHSIQRVSIDGMRPLALTKKQTIAVLGSAKLVDRMLWATRHAGGKWFMIIREGRDPSRRDGIRRVGLCAIGEGRVTTAHAE
jgi:hypothetical protein